MHISIRNHQFSLSAPYGAGHQLTLAEAHALNGLRGENIRDAVAKRFGQRALDAQGLQRLHELVQQYDLQYQFKEPSKQAGPQGGKWSLEAVARALAEQQVSRVEGEAEEEEICRVAALPETLQAAAKQIEAEKQVAAQALEELLSD